MANKYDAVLKKMVANTDKLPEMVEKIKAAIGGARKSELEEAAKKYDAEKEAREKAETELSTAQSELEAATEKYKTVEGKYKQADKSNKDLSKARGELEKKVTELEETVVDQDVVVATLIDVAGKYHAALKELYAAAQQEEAKE